MLTDDRELITRIFESHYGAIVAYFVRRVRDRSDAEELAQSTFEFAWRRVQQIPPEPDTRQWLYQVARRQASNYWRSSNRRKRLFERNSTLQNIQLANDNQEDFSDAENMLMAAFLQLPESQREVLRLVGWDELSHTEAAAILGCSVNAFDIRLHRARVALKSRLAMLDQSDTR